MAPARASTSVDDGAPAPVDEAETPRRPITSAVAHVRGSGPGRSAGRGAVRGAATAVAPSGHGESVSIVPAKDRTCPASGPRCHGLTSGRRSPAARPRRPPEGRPRAHRRPRRTVVVPTAHRCSDWSTTQPPRPRCTATAAEPVHQPGDAVPARSHLDGHGGIGPAGHRIGGPTGQPAAEARTEPAATSTGPKGGAKGARGPRGSGRSRAAGPAAAPPRAAAGPVRDRRR